MRNSVSERQRRLGNTAVSSRSLFPFFTVSLSLSSWGFFGVSFCETLSHLPPFFPGKSSTSKIRKGGSTLCKSWWGSTLVETWFSQMALRFRRQYLLSTFCVTLPTSRAPGSRSHCLCGEKKARITKVK